MGYTKKLYTDKQLSSKAKIGLSDEKKKVGGKMMAHIICKCKQDIWNGDPEHDVDQIWLSRDQLLSLQSQKRVSVNESAPLTYSVWKCYHCGRLHIFAQEGPRNIGKKLKTYARIKRQGSIKQQPIDRAKIIYMYSQRAWQHQIQTLEDQIKQKRELLLSGHTGYYLKSEAIFVTGADDPQILYSYQLEHDYCGHTLFDQRCSAYQKYLRSISTEE